MGQVTETIRETNRFIRTIVGCAVIGAVGYGGGWVYQNYHPDGRLREKAQQLEDAQKDLQVARVELEQRGAQVEQLSADLVDAQQRIDQLDTSMRLLKVDLRVAQIDVLKQTEDPQSGRLLTEITFQETTEDGTPIEQAKRFVVEGDHVYVDYWVVKFEDKYVEQADVEKATSICLFRRLFGEYQKPHQGYTLDEVNSRPNAYGRGEMSDFEKRIWKDFWNISNDPPRASQMGIRAMHNEAVGQQLREGMRYRVLLRASGGLSIEALPKEQPDMVPPTA